METATNITTADALFKRCESYVETINELNERLNYASEGLYQKLHELLCLILNKLNKNGDEIFTLELDGDVPYDDVLYVSTNINDGLTWFAFTNGTALNDDCIDVLVLARLVKYIKERYDK